MKFRIYIYFILKYVYLIPHVVDFSGKRALELAYRNCK